MPFIFGWLILIHYYADICCFLHKIFIRILWLYRLEFGNDVVESEWTVRILPTRTLGNLRVYNSSDMDILPLESDLDSREDSESECGDYKVSAHWNIVVTPCSGSNGEGEGFNRCVGLSLAVIDSYGDVCGDGCVDVLMSAEVFFRFPLLRVVSYLIESVANEDGGERCDAILAVDIARIVGEYSLLDVGEMPVSLKTYWIAIIQRRWRKIYAERIALLLKRGGILAQRHFELHGNYGRHVDIMPGLRGMLSDMSSSRWLARSSIYLESEDTKTD